MNKIDVHDPVQVEPIQIEMVLNLGDSSQIDGRFTLQHACHS